MKQVFRYLSKTNQSHFLFGPRGTGKTTWLKANYPDAYYIDLLSTKLFINYSSNPERLIKIYFKWLNCYIAKWLKTLIINTKQLSESQISTRF